MAEASHPLRDALNARDVELLRPHLADNVIVRSPIFTVEIDGPDEACEVLDAVYKTVGEIEYLYDEPASGEKPHVFAWRSDVDGEELEGVDIVRYDADGKIVELTVLMRPLRGIAAFLDKGGRIIGRNRSPGRAALIRVMGGPPSMMMRSAATLGPKMLGLKRAKKNRA